MFLITPESKAKMVCSGFPINFIIFIPQQCPDKKLFSIPPDGIIFSQSRFDITDIGLEKQRCTSTTSTYRQLESAIVQHAVDGGMNPTKAFFQRPSIHRRRVKICPKYVAECYHTAPLPKFVEKLHPAEALGGRFLHEWQFHGVWRGGT